MDKSKDKATLSTQPNAISDLQGTLKGVMKERYEAKKNIHVGLIGPGEIHDEKTGVRYSPQVEETIQTLLQSRKNQSVLHVYDYKPDGRHGDSTKPHTWAQPPRLVQHAEDSKRSVLVVHHNFDLTNPDPNDPHKNDMVIATRVVGPVTSGVTADKKDLIAMNLRAKVANGGELLMDAFAGKKMSQSHRGQMGKHELSGNTTDAKRTAVIKLHRP